VWAYQGSKPFVFNGRLYSSMGDKVTSVDSKTGKAVWSRTINADQKSALLNSEITPPAIVNGKIFVGTRSGEVLALSQDSGEVLWRVAVGEPVIFQPTVAAGRIYISTERGSLVCLNSGDPRDDGWLM
jgi:outer membrane protein assembly factor BamB